MFRSGSGLPYPVPLSLVRPCPAVRGAATLTLMADSLFAAPERRNYTLPILLALAALALAGLFLYRNTPHTTADVEITHVDVYPAHVEFTTESNVVGPKQTEDVLYILATVRITDRLRLPLFLKDFTASLVPSDGSLQPATSAVERSDLLNLYSTFPQLGTLARQQTAPPLLRESRIDPGQTATGFVLLHFPIKPEVWNTRNDFILTIDLYHQASLSVALPPNHAASVPAPVPAK